MSEDRKDSLSEILNGRKQCLEMKDDRTTER